VDAAAGAAVDVAAQMNGRRVVVAVDLVGYTTGGERANEVMAARPAAVQLSYMVRIRVYDSSYVAHTNGIDTRIHKVGCKLGCIRVCSLRYRGWVGQWALRGLKVNKLKGVLRLRRRGAG
jgi:hypothetical protein